MAMDTVLDGRVGTPPAATVARGEMRDWGGWYNVDHGGEVCTTGGIILPAAFHLHKAALVQWTSIGSSTRDVPSD